MVDRPPVDPGALHRRIGDAELRQPRRHLLQRPPERLEALDGHLALTRRAARQPDRDPDHLLMHVDPGHARMDDIHRHLPADPPPMERARRPRSPQQDQDPVTRARSSNPGYLPGGLQRPSIGQAHSTKAQRRQRGRTQVSPICGRHDRDMGSIGRMARSGPRPVPLWQLGPDETSNPGRSYQRKNFGDPTTSCRSGLIRFLPLITNTGSRNQGPGQKQDATYR